MRVELRNQVVSGENARAIIAGGELFRISFVLNIFVADFPADGSFGGYFVTDVRLQTNAKIIAEAQAHYAAVIDLVLDGRALLWRLRFEGRRGIGLLRGGT